MKEWWKSKILWTLAAALVTVVGNGVSDGFTTAQWIEAALVFIGMVQRAFFTTKPVLTG